MKLRPAGRASYEALTTKLPYVRIGLGLPDFQISEELLLAAPAHIGAPLALNL